MQQQGIERRRAPRATVNFPIQISTKTEAAPATLKDISSNGLCCTYHEPVREMTIVRMDVKFPGEQDVHRIDGVVVRCAKRRGEFPPTYEIAVYFAEMTEAARKTVERFVTKTLDQPAAHRANK